MPTLLILADPAPDSMTVMDGERPVADQAMNQFNMLDSTLRRGLASGLPMVVVAASNLARQARTMVPGNDVIELPADLPPLSRADRLARAVAAGVAASAQAPGWILLPADMPVLQVDTLRAVAQAVLQYTVVFPQYRQLRGHPVGFSAELFSELIRLDNERDLARLTTRYPAMGLEVNDPGVLMQQSGHSGLEHFQRPWHSESEMHL
ncbi:MAG: NTP transferase domain-containing protein [Burkholderiales bacterium]|nr:NTP transferase domain-containing protein [Burkholderiales bacterium]